MLYSLVLRVSGSVHVILRGASQRLGVTFLMAGAPASHTPAAHLIINQPASSNTLVFSPLPARLFHGAQPEVNWLGLQCGRSMGSTTSFSYLQSRAFSASCALVYIHAPEAARSYATEPY